MNVDTPPERSAKSGTPANMLNTSSAGVLGIADADSAGTGAAPPHLLWETLESAFAEAETDPSGLATAPERGRLAGYIAMPITLVLSLILWVVIVEMVVRR